MKKTQFMSGMATALMSLSLLQAADTCTRWNKLEVTGGQFVSADGMIVSAYMTIIACGTAVRIYGEEALKMFCASAAKRAVKIRLATLASAPTGQPLASIEGARGIAALMQDRRVR